MELTLGYHRPRLPGSEEKQDYSISPKRQTVWTPLFHMAPIGISCSLELVFTSDSYRFVFIT